MVSMTLYLMDLGNTIEMGGLVNQTQSSSRSVVNMDLRNPASNEWILFVRSHLCDTKTG